MLRPECALPVRCRPGQDAGGHGRGPRLQYVGIQALRRLAADLDPARLSGNVILLPLANPVLLCRAKQVVPEDGVNLNQASRQLCGPPFRSIGLCPGGGFLYPVADLLADLHSGDCSETLHPLVFFPAAGKKMVNQVSLDAAKVLTVPYRVRSTAKNGLYSWAVQRDIPALLIERGGQGLV